MRLRAGEVFNAFNSCRVMRLLSHTETKSTYEVEWQGRPAVLKLVKFEPNLPANHPLWAPVLERTPLPEGWALLQERAQGSTLGTVLKFGSPALEQRLRWARELCRFFETACPTTGVADLSNVLVDEDGNLRVISLGRLEGGETPLARFGMLLEATLPDSAPMVWLASRCRDGRFSNFGQVAQMLDELDEAHAPADEIELSAESASRPWLWLNAVAGLVLALVIAGMLWTRPVTRTEPAVYLSRGDSVLVLAESSGRRLGSFRTEDEVTGMAASEAQGSLYLAYRDSPFIEVVEGREHRPVARLKAQPGASRLLYSGKTLIAVYPALSLIVLLDTDGKAAQPLALAEPGEALVAGGEGVVAVAQGRNLEVYRLHPFALLASTRLEAPATALWSENGSPRLAIGSKLFEVQAADGSLSHLPGSTPANPGMGLETAHGFWRLEGERLSKHVGHGGSVLQTWTAERGASLAYLEKVHAR